MKIVGFISCLFDVGTARPLENAILWRDSRLMMKIKPVIIGLSLKG
jgi:hypothetical protein